MNVHWTGRSVKDYLFRIAADFIAQLENKMESLNISQDELAKKLGVTKGRVSQLINHPGNIGLAKIIEYARALGMKVSIVANEDNDPENKKGPVNSEIFRICWDKSGRPRDFWDMQKIVNTNVTAATYFPISQHLATTVHVANVPIKIYNAELLHEWAILPGNFATCPVYFPIGHFAGNQSPAIFKRDELLPS